MKKLSGTTFLALVSSVLATFILLGGLYLIFYKLPVTPQSIFSGIFLLVGSTILFAIAAKCYQHDQQYGESDSQEETKIISYIKPSDYQYFL